MTGDSSNTERLVNAVDMESKKAEGNVYNGENYQRDDEDDEKMEKFYALIRNFHEARNRRKEELREANKKNKIRKLDHRQEQASWVPKFEWQDFTEEIEFRKLPAIFPSPSNKKEDHKKQPDEDHHNLDLKLGL